jgi:hypothetical protein
MRIRLFRNRQHPNSLDCPQAPIVNFLRWMTHRTQFPATFPLWPQTLIDEEGYHKLPSWNASLALRPYRWGGFATLAPWTQTLSGAVVKPCSRRVHSEKFFQSEYSATPLGGKIRCLQFSHLFRRGAFSALWATLWARHLWDARLLPSAETDPIFHSRRATESEAGLK